MKRIALAVATAAAVFTAGWSFGGVIPAVAENLRMAQLNVPVDRDRNVGEERSNRDRRDSGVTVGVGPGGIVVRPKEHCRTVTTTVERDDGRRVTRKERVCD